MADMTSGAGHAAEHTQLSEIEVSHKAGKRQWVISEKVLRGICFSGPAPQPLDEPAAPLHKTVHEAVSWPRPYPFKLGKSKVQSVCNSTSNLWWGKPSAWDEQCHRNPIRFLRQGMQPKGKSSNDAAGSIRSNIHKFRAYIYQATKNLSLYSSGR